MEASHSALSYVYRARDEIAGMPLRDTPWWKQSGIDEDQFTAAIATAASGAVEKMEAGMVNRKGSRPWFDFSLDPVPGKSGKVLLIVVEGCVQVTQNII